MFWHEALLVASCLVGLCRDTKSAIWSDLRETLDTRRPTKIAELNQCCEEEVPPKHRAGLIHGYRRLLLTMAVPCMNKTAITTIIMYV